MAKHTLEAKFVNGEVIYNANFTFETGADAGTVALGFGLEPFQVDDDGVVYNTKWLFCVEVIETTDED